MIQLVATLVSSKSVLLHQIRLMVGASLAVALGVLPPYAIDVALQTVRPHKLVLPLAPAEGLVLFGCGFSRYPSQQFEASFDFNKTLPPAASSLHKNLLSLEAMCHAHSFFEQSMVPHIHETLVRQHTDDESRTVFGEWFVKDLERFQTRMHKPLQHQISAMTVIEEVENAWSELQEEKAINKKMKFS